MFGQRPSSPTSSGAQLSDPNELLQRIDAQSRMTYHWVRAGVIVIILLLIVVVLVG